MIDRKTECPVLKDRLIIFKSQFARAGQKNLFLMAGKRKFFGGRRVIIAYLHGKCNFFGKVFCAGEAGAAHRFSTKAPGRGVEISDVELCKTPEPPDTRLYCGEKCGILLIRTIGRTMKFKTKLAVWACKASGAVLRRLGRGGTNLPGKIALRIDPDILGELSRGIKVTVVTGTNGKTTTAHMIEQAFADAGLK